MAGKNKAAMSNSIVVKKATSAQSGPKNTSAMGKGIVVKSATNPQSMQKNAKASVSPTKYKKA